ncbi:MAG TPA: matrixin family metalloprotease [Gemmatimonadaceae bacterium]
MKRSETATFTALFGALLAIAAFIGVQVWRAPRRAPKAGAAVTDSAAGASPEAGSLSRVRKSSLPPPPPHDYAEISRLLSDESGATYMDAILAARGGNVARWVERRANPVTVWVQPTTALKDFWPQFVDRTHDAFYTWAAAGIPMRFLFVDDSSQAEVHVVWVDRFDDSAAGKTYWTRDPNWWIVGADIELALHRPTGEAYDDQMIRTIALHEVGHLIGLDHSPDPDDIMSPKVHVTSLSAADLRTAALIYKLPPGPVEKPAP